MVGHSESESERDFLDINKHKLKCATAEWLPRRIAQIFPATVPGSNPGGGGIWMKIWGSLHYRGTTIIDVTGASSLPVTNPLPSEVLQTYRVGDPIPIYKTQTKKKKYLQKHSKLATTYFFTFSFYLHRTWLRQSRSC